MKSTPDVTGGELLLDSLRTNQIKSIFYCPGSEWVCLLAALAHYHNNSEPFPAYINCWHEDVAVAMAMGYAKVTGRIPAVLLHNNVGPLHAAMAIRAAYHAGDPLLICAGDASGKEDYEADSLTGWTWLNRLSDSDGVESLVRGYVKWSVRVDSPRDIQDAVSQGCRIARQAPRGPVLISIPWNILVSAQDAPSVSFSFPPAVASGSEPELLNRVAAILVQSELPVIVTEYSGRNPEVVPILVRLSELLAIPVLEMVDPAFSNFPPDHPLYIGDRSSEVLERADTVLLVGVNTPWYPPDAYPNKDGRVILLDEDTAKSRMPHWSYRTHMRLSGDLGSTLSALTDAVKTLLVDSEGEKVHFKARFRRWQQEHEEMVAEWRSAGQKQKSGAALTPAGFFYRLGGIVPKNALILDETVSQSYLIRRYLGRPGHYIRAGAGGLGIGLGVAAGVKLARKENTVILFVGDGTFMFNPVLAALVTCKAFCLPILIILCNNGGYEAIRNAYRKYCPKEGAETYLGVDFDPGQDYVKVIEALGGLGEQISRPGAIENAFNRGLEQLGLDKCYLIDVLLP